MANMLAHGARFGTKTAMPSVNGAGGIDRHRAFLSAFRATPARSARRR
jgi:hypothetical protein